jgi:hypothetical protein
VLQVNLQAGRFIKLAFNEDCFSKKLLKEKYLEEEGWVSRPSFFCQFGYLAWLIGIKVVRRFTTVATLNRIHEL